MRIYVKQLRQSIRAKIDHIDDADYLASLDAILTYETISNDGKIPHEEKQKGNFSLKKLLLRPFMNTRNG